VKLSIDLKRKQYNTNEFEIVNNTAPRSYAFVNMGISIISSFEKDFRFAVIQNCEEKNIGSASFHFVCHDPSLHAQ